MDSVRAHKDREEHKVEQQRVNRLTREKVRDTTCRSFHSLLFDCRCGSAVLQTHTHKHQTAKPNLQTGIHKHQHPQPSNWHTQPSNWHTQTSTSTSTQSTSKYPQHIHLTSTTHQPPSNQTSTSTQSTTKHPPNINQQHNPFTHIGTQLPHNNNNNTINFNTTLQLALQLQPQQQQQQQQQITSTFNLSITKSSQLIKAKPNHTNPKQKHNAINTAQRWAGQHRSDHARQQQRQQRPGTLWQRQQQ